MDQELKKTGARVKAARLAKHITQKQLAQAASISVSYLSKIENGKVPISIHALIGITEALDVSSDFLLRDIPEDLSGIIDEIKKEVSSFTIEEQESLLRIIRKMKKLKSYHNKPHNECILSSRYRRFWNL